jgi:hypothetical protein
MVKNTEPQFQAADAAELKRWVRCVSHLGELPAALAFVDANDLMYADFSMG